MASRRPGTQHDGADEAANLEKAFQELAKGEQTATALENQLSKMEARIQALLDQAESEQREVQQIKGNRASSGTTEEQTDKSNEGEKS